MKKALAIVWTLLLVACLLPPAHAVTQIVTGGGFTVECAVITPDDPNPMMESALCLEENHYEFSYAYSALLPVETGKFTEDAAMLCVRVSGFDQFSPARAPPPSPSRWSWGSRADAKPSASACRVRETA